MLKMASEVHYNFTCVAESNKWKHIVFIFLPAISGILNIIILLAATIHRQKLLRQSYIYLCVVSTLLSNTLYLSLHLWNEFVLYLMPPSESVKPPPPHLQLLWTLCHSGAIALLFGMCCNLATLIYAMIESTYFQSASRDISATERLDTTKLIRAKRTKAIVALIISWTLPAVLTVVSVQGWNCATRCHCSPGAVGEICLRRFGCSAVWVPLTTSFMAVNIGFWFLEIIGLAMLIFSAVRNFQSFVSATSASPQRTNSNMSGLEPVAENATTAAEQMTADNHQKIVENDPQCSTFTKKSGLFQCYKSNPRLRCVFLLSLLFTVCTFPTVVAFFVDIFVAHFNIEIVQILTTEFMHIYTLVCPILLLKYLSGLKTAVSRFFTSIFFCFN